MAYDGNYNNCEGFVAEALASLASPTPSNGKGP